jgi:predicted transposase YdaD
MWKGGFLMAKVWDRLMKMLARANPQDVVSLVLQGTQYVSDVTNEQIIRAVEADFLCNALRNEQEIVVHVEFQRYHDSNMSRRMWEYNIATTYLTQLPVCSFALYLWKDTSIVEPPFILRLVDGNIIHIFYYENIFLWEIPPERLQQKGLEGLLPLLPLTQGAKEARDKIVNDMIEGLRAAGKEDILALGYAFAGRVYKTKDDQKWLKRRFAMFEDFLEESWSYQEMVQKGLDKGIELGKKQGVDQGIEIGKKQGIEQGIEIGEKQGLERALNALRPTLISVVQARFPELTDLAQQQGERFTVPELLSDVIDKLLKVQTVEQARRILMQLDQVPDTPHPDA